MHNLFSNNARPFKCALSLQRTAHPLFTPGWDSNIAGLDTVVQIWMKENISMVGRQSTHQVTYNINWIKFVQIAHVLYRNYLLIKLFWNITITSMVAVILKLISFCYSLQKPVLLNRERDITMFMPCPLWRWLFVKTNAKATSLTLFSV